VDVNKRTAIALAGGVTGALVSGVVGYSASLEPAASADRAAPTKPIVRTEIRTITIHKKAKSRAAKPSPVTIVHRPSGGSSSGSSSVHHTGGSHHQGGDDDDEGHGHGGDD
jgi:hypothetical protein